MSTIAIQNATITTAAGAMAALDAAVNAAVAAPAARVEARAAVVAAAIKVAMDRVDAAYEAGEGVWEVEKELAAQREALRNAVEHIPPHEWAELRRLARAVPQDSYYGWIAAAPRGVVATGELPDREMASLVRSRGVGSLQ